MTECLLILGSICFVLAMLGLIAFTIGASKGKTEQERLYEDQEQVRFLRERNQKQKQKQKHLQTSTTN